MIDYSIRERKLMKEYRRQHAPSQGGKQAGRGTRELDTEHMGALDRAARLPHQGQPAHFSFFFFLYAVSMSVRMVLNPRGESDSSRLTRAMKSHFVQSFSFSAYVPWT